MPYKNPACILLLALACNAVRADANRGIDDEPTTTERYDNPALNDAFHVTVKGLCLEGQSKSQAYSRTFAICRIIHHDKAALLRQCFKKMSDLIERVYELEPIGTPMQLVGVPGHPSAAASSVIADPCRAVGPRYLEFIAPTIESLCDSGLPRSTAIQIIDAACRGVSEANPDFDYPSHFACQVSMLEKCYRRRAANAAQQAERDDESRPTSE